MPKLYQYNGKQWIEIAKNGKDAKDVPVEEIKNKITEQVTETVTKESTTLIDKQFINIQKAVASKSYGLEDLTNVDTSSLTKDENGNWIISGGGVPNGGTTGQALIKQSNNDGDADWETLPGGGDMLSSIYDPASKAAQVVVESEIADFETTTQLNARDTANRDRTNHTGTQTASTVSDFDTAVAANSAVAANTAKRSYPIADENKLATIEEGAEVNTLNDVIAGTNVTIDKTDPLNPVISSTATGGGSFTVATPEEINTGEDNEKGVTPQGLRDSLYPRVYRQDEEPTLADGDVWVNTGEEEVDTSSDGQTEEFDNGNSGTAVTIDWNNGRFQKVTVNNTTTLTFINPPFVGQYSLRIIQDATGGHDVNLPANVVFVYSEPDWTEMPANSKSILNIRYDGDDYVASATPSYAS